MRTRAEPQFQEKTWRISVVLNKRSERLSVERETRGGMSPKTFERNAAPSNPCGPSRDRGVCSMPLEEACTFSFKRDDPSFNAPIYANLFDAESRRYRRGWRRKVA